MVLGYSCNNRCVFCSVGDKRNLKDKTTEEAKLEVLALRKRGYEGIQFIGGEPTIRKDISEIVSYCKELGFEEVSFESNGRMFAYPGFCNKMKKAGLTNVSVSLHGHCKEVHDYLTQAPDSFDETIKGISNLVSLGIISCINCVLTQKNLPHIDKFINLAQKIKVKKILFLVINPIGLAKGRIDLVPKISDVGKCLEKIKDSSLSIAIKNMPHCINPKISQNIIKSDSNMSMLMEARLSNMQENIEKLKVKNANCSGCSKNKECGGIWKGYVEIYGDKEISACDVKKK